MSRTDDRLDAIEAATAARAQADDSTRDLIALLLDPARFAAHVEGLESRITAATAADAAMTAELAAFDSQAGETRKANAAEHAAINETGDLDQLIAKEAELTVRRETIAKLKREWRNFGESDEVHSGFRDPLFPALVKARRAHDPHGRLPVGEPDPHFPAGDGADGRHGRRGANTATGSPARPCCKKQSRQRRKVSWRGAATVAPTSAKEASDETALYS
jgi:hypothetical protein